MKQNLLEVLPLGVSVRNTYLWEDREWLMERNAGVFVFLEINKNSHIVSTGMSFGTKVKKGR